MLAYPQRSRHIRRCICTASHCMSTIVELSCIGQGLQGIAWRTYITDGLERVLLARAEHGQHICVHVNLYFLIAFQLVTQSYVRFTWIQLAPATNAPHKLQYPVLWRDSLPWRGYCLPIGSTASTAVSMSTRVSQSRPQYYVCFTWVQLAPAHAPNKPWSLVL